MYLAQAVSASVGHQDLAPCSALFVLLFLIVICWGIFALITGRHDDHQ